MENRVSVDIAIARARGTSAKSPCLRFQEARLTTKLNAVRGRRRILPSDRVANTIARFRGRVRREISRFYAANL